jgi:hypothetical protein
MHQHVAYPHDLVHRLSATIALLQAEAPSRETVPTEEQVEFMLDAAWSATLLEEEGRRCTFTLGFVSEHEVHGTSCQVLAFAQPMPCRPQAIAKLALATDPRETIIGVHWSRARELTIWGLLQLGEPGSLGDADARPRFLHVTGFRPGGLLVESHARRLLLYMNGVAHWYESGAENITTLLRDTLHSTALSLGSSGGSLAHEFERLAERLVLAGHGGSLIIAGAGVGDVHSCHPHGVHLPPTTTFRAANTCLREAFLDDEQFSRGASAATLGERPGRLRFDVEREHLSALDHVARLSNVDGAVVMSPDLCVFGFGATIDLSEDTVIPAIDLFDLTEADSPPRAISVDEFQGHRHKSAVHFCAMQLARDEARLALAIVASQDGTLSLFGLVGKTIAVYRPLILRSVSVR